LVVVLLYGDEDEAADPKKKKRWLQTDRHIGQAAGILAALIKAGKEPEQTVIQIITGPWTIQPLKSKELIGLIEASKK
jgi:hypothetical protein